MITRFAPSPTGHLHLGHAYAAKFASDLAAENGGHFLLRFEDIDTTRVREQHYAEIEQDLRWLGIEWSGTPLRQLDRLAAYAEALEKLKAMNVVYPCFCTRKNIQHEIESMSNAPHGPEGVLYPGTCKNLTKSERDERLSRGDAHAWRLDTSAASQRVGKLSFTDTIHGTIEVDPFLLGDVVLARKDIATSYHLAVVVDDAFQKITDVTRGEDLLASTHVHRILQELLALSEPTYHHHRVVLDDSGKRLAKRDDSLSISTFRELGKSPDQVLAMIG
ncbi:MAG: tRNA glutamyl-Q(34) synthetase GluQRS [Akkermansiaceae bacterium]